MKLAQEHLISHNIKPSVQRMFIMDYLLENKIHPTADMIFNELYAKMPTLSRTTVYNTLKLLVEEKAIQMITIDEKNARYDADTSEHAHFKCKGCGEVFDVVVSGIDEITVKADNGFVVDDIQVYCRGYCKKCKENHI